MSHLCQPGLTLLFADHELKTPSKRNMLRKKLSHHIVFSSLEFLYSCNCYTTMVIKPLPAQTHLFTTQNQDLLSEKSKGHSQAEKDNLFSENAGSAMVGLPTTSFSNPACLNRWNTRRFWLFRLGWGLRCCCHTWITQVEVRQVGHYSVCVFDG